MNAKIAASEAGPPCRDCFYCGDEKPTPVCHHLVYAEPRFDPALGKYQGKSHRLITGARGGDGYCGPEGLLFEPKSAIGRVRALVTSDRATGVYVWAGFFAIILAGVWF